MREVVFRVLAERPGHLEAQAVGAAFSAGVTLPIRITLPIMPWPWFRWVPVGRSSCRRELLRELREL